MRAPSKGFTLVEQLLTVAASAILVGVAIPAMGSMLRSTDVTLTANALVNAMHMARQAAVQGNAVSMLCPSKDGRHCSHHADWQDGWLLALDRNHDNQPDGSVLATGTPTHSGVSVLGSRSRIHLRFHPGGSSAGSNVTLLICKTGSSRGARHVVLSNTGRVRSGVATKAQAARCAALDDPDHG